MKKEILVPLIFNMYKHNNHGVKKEKTLNKWIEMF